MRTHARMHAYMRTHARARAPQVRAVPFDMVAPASCTQITFPLAVRGSGSGAATATRPHARTHTGARAQAHTRAGARAHACAHTRRRTRAHTRARAYAGETEDALLAAI